MKPFQPIPRVTLSEQVAHQIVDMISAGHIQRGQKLPPESELCRSFHVGRSTLREALKSLAFVGVVRMRPGEGSFVAEGPSKFLDQVLNHGLLNTERDVSELADTRILIETELATLCARRRTEADLQRLDYLVSEMQRSVLSGGTGLLQLDMEFHFAIGNGSQNHVLSQLLQTIGGLLKEYISRSLQVPGSAEVTLKEHQKILKAIQQRNSQRARAAMLSHLQTFRRAYALLVKASESEAVDANLSGASRIVAGDEWETRKPAPVEAWKS